jgi:hypothetical protein
MLPKLSMSLTQRMNGKRFSETAASAQREKILKMPFSNKQSPKRGVTPNQGVTRLMAQQCLKD